MKGISKCYLRGSLSDMIDCALLSALQQSYSMYNLVIQYFGNHFKSLTKILGGVIFVEVYVFKKINLAFRLNKRICDIFGIKGNLCII